MRTIEDDVVDVAAAVEIMWLFLNAVIVMWMQVGFAMLEVGSVRVFFVQNILIKNVVDTTITIALYFVVGFAFAGNSGNGFIGTQYFLLRDVDTRPQDAALFLFAIAFASSAVTIVSGALAERCKLVAYFTFAAVMSAFTYPLVSHWVWSSYGWLSPYNSDRLFTGVIGYMDYAGSSVVHAMGGMSALIAVIMLGPRYGRFSVDGDVCELAGGVGNSGVYRVLGALLLFVSFFSFNASSVQAWQRIQLSGLIGMNTAISSSFGCFAVMVWKLVIRNFQVHIMHCIDGLLAGSVAITASACLVHPWAAALIGTLGGIFYVQTSDLMLKFKLDDVVNAVAVHLAPGVWGVLAIGLFARPDNIQRAYSIPALCALSDGENRSIKDFAFLGLCSAALMSAVVDMWDAEGFEGGIIHGGTGKQLGVQLLGITVILAWVCATIGPTFGLLKYFNMLRLSTELQISVHSGVKSSAENYSWQQYPNPKIISLGQGNAEVPQARPAESPSPSAEAPSQNGQRNNDVSHRAGRALANFV